MAGVGVALAGCGHARSNDLPSTEPSASTSPGTDVNSMPATSAPPPSAGALEAAWVDGLGYAHSDLPSSGTFVYNTVTVPTTATNPDVRAWVLQMEDAIPLPVDEIAARIQTILDDERSWRWDGRIAFSLINEPARADLTIQLATGRTTDVGCGELGTSQILSCRVGNTVYLNVDRWAFGTPTWASQPVEEYRGYLVNHEVGHYLGLGHVGCPVNGGPSPVMQQQSLKLDSCAPNAWPAVTGETGIG